ncbi:Uncharacterised protein [Escherichia coli]|nr:Uncharacterised protein [Escherichia coli]SVF31698.1 Uncharacterised protein [Escherichia coli]
MSHILINLPFSQKVALIYQDVSVYVLRFILTIPMDKELLQMKADCTFFPAFYWQDTGPPVGGLI